MKTFKVALEISAECKADARELLENFTGEETDLTIKTIKEVKE